MLPTFSFAFFPDSTTEPSGFLRFLPRTTIRDRRWSELSQALRCRCQRPHQLQAAECHLAGDCRTTSLAFSEQLCFCENGPIITRNQLFNHHNHHITIRIYIYNYIYKYTYYITHSKTPFWGVSSILSKWHGKNRLPELHVQWQFPGFHPGLRNSSSLELHSHKLRPMGPKGMG